MLYDVFICHASEDKESFVRPLAEALRNRNVAVWYDDFELKLGDSIRRALDRGLRECRFGLVVLSSAFFDKRWPQYELDALAQREMRGQDKVLLPVWHGVTHDAIMQYSPALADRRAASSANGLLSVVDEVLGVVHPQQSPLIVARDTALEWGMSPPVITDEYWLEVVEASNRLPGYGMAIPEQSCWTRWSFPLPDKEGGPQQWGERLAWTAMQMGWVDAAESIPITPLSPPAVVLAFVSSHPGLLETCMDFPEFTAEYAPQLTIPGFGGPLEKRFEERYRKSCDKQKKTRARGSAEGSALTANEAAPLCEEQWMLRHPKFGNYNARTIASAYFASEMWGPRVSPYEGADHVFWLLSSASAWLPADLHAALIQGMKDWVNGWPWHDAREKWATSGKLSEAIWNSVEKRRSFQWTPEAKKDALNRISVTVNELGLLETPAVIFSRFAEQRFPQHNIEMERNLRRKRSGRHTRPPRRTGRTNEDAGATG